MPVRQDLLPENHKRVPESGDGLRDKPRVDCYPVFTKDGIDAGGQPGPHRRDCGSRPMILSPSAPRMGR